MPHTSKPPTYADTSFLCSLVLLDTNSAAAAAHLHAHPAPLALTDWHACELRNAIRLAVFRSNCTATAATGALGRIETNLASGNLVTTALIWPDVLAQAEKISAAHTVPLGLRTLDLLHLAAAHTLGAKTFLTFGNRQRTAALAAGFAAPIP